MTKTTMGGHVTRIQPVSENTTHGTNSNKSNPQLTDCEATNGFFTAVYELKLAQAY